MAALSAATIWEQQRSFFITEGPRVWRDSIVPSYVSTNPFLGGFLAEVLAAYIAEVGTPIDVIELGGGSGQLAFHVLRQLQARLGDCGGVRYVLTDLAPSMLHYWRHHRSLLPFVDAGQLDFAEFDVSRPAPLHLTESGDILGAGPADRPAAVIASYCFDSVPQDLFAVDEDGRLFECVVPEPRPDSAGGGWPDTGGADSAGDSGGGWPDSAGGRGTGDGGDRWPEAEVLSFERRPCLLPHYREPDLDAALSAVLSGYRSLGRAAMVPFPNTAIGSLAFLADRYQGGLLALVGDRGFTRPEHSEVLSVLEPTRHGSVSLPVNFHAIGEWFLGRGGVAWHPDHLARSFNVSAFAVSPAPASTRPLAGTEATFRAAAASRDPDTFFTVKKAVQGHYGDFSVGEAIAFLRLSQWDADIFDAMFLHLVERLADDPPDDAGRAELVAAVGHVWDGYYPVRDTDMAFQAGTVLYAGGAYPEALQFFGRSLARNGSTVDAWLNSALCHHMLGARDQALACVGRALELAPGLDQAVTLLEELIA